MKKPKPRVRLTRRVTFSSGLRFWISKLDPNQNRALFGNLASPFNHGHNYLLDVTVEGLVNEEDGMVVNIKEIDALLKARIVALFHGKSINDEVPPFADTPPSLENLVLCIWDLIAEKPIRLRSNYVKSWRWDADLLKDSPESLQLPGNCSLVEIRLEAMPGLHVNLISNFDRNLMTFTRSYEFAASHRLHLTDLTDEENFDLFGKCNNQAGHGHNYVLEVTVEGEPKSESGMLVDLVELDRRVCNRVVDRYDHRNLNEDIPELRGLNPTSEIVALKIFELLNGHLPAKLHGVKLHETARNSFEVLAP